MKHLGSIPQALKWPFIELHSMNCHRMSFWGGTISSKFLLQQEMIHIVDHSHWNDCTKLARPFFSLTLSYTFGLVWLGECDIVLGGDRILTFQLYRTYEWVSNSVWRWLFWPICFWFWWQFIEITCNLTEYRNDC